MSNRFNLENYITVKQRKQMFYVDHPTGVIIPELISDPNRASDFVVIKARIWRDRVSAQQGLPPDGVGLSYSQAGGKAADEFAWMENCEESAIGRALDNMGYATDNRCSRDEMEKVQYMSTVGQKSQQPSYNKAPSQQVSKPPQVQSRPEQDKPSPKEEVSMIKEGQVEAIKKSISMLNTKNDTSMSVEEFLVEKMNLDKKTLEELTFKEAVACIKWLNDLMSPQQQS